VQAEPVSFEGDLPPSAGREMNQYRLVFAEPPPLISEVDDVTYTDSGLAWSRGRLERRYSLQEIGLRQVLETPQRPTARYERGTLLQSQTPRTYGDWMSEHVASLAKALIAGRLVEPLVLPSWWYAKPYVQRDLRRLAIRAVAVNGAASIERATIINKTRPGHWWTREEAEAVRAAMKIVPIATDVGSALYLSRSGFVGEGPQRRIDNDLIEAAMAAAGIQVVRTAGLSLEGYLAHAASAETVFFDHGSAIYNMLHWQTRRLVELFTPAYWDASFLIFADALGINDYHVWGVDSETTVDGLAQRIAGVMAKPAARRNAGHA
jgi:capsular polysaccharide biosynthesis protein